jgi:hypothetical protein
VCQGPPPADFHELAIGPAWRGADGHWSRLAEFPDAKPYRPSEAKPAEGPRGTLAVLHESPGEVQFRVGFDWHGTRVTERVTLNASGVRVDDEVVGPGVDALRIYFPMLVSDGQQETKVTPDGRQVTLELDGRAQQFTLLEPAEATLQRLNQRFKHRNGLIEPVFADVAGHTAAFAVRAVKAMPGGRRLDSRPRLLSAAHLVADQLPPRRYRHQHRPSTPAAISALASMSKTLPSASNLGSKGSLPIGGASILAAGEYIRALSKTASTRVRAAPPLSVQEQPES